MNIVPRIAFLGAHGGARGFNPYPARRREAPSSGRGRIEQQYPHVYKAIVMGNTANPTVVRKDKERKTLVITPFELKQPWQKHDAKLKARAIATHRDWNERREARESRKTLEAQFAGMQP